MQEERSGPGDPAPRETPFTTAWMAPARTVFERIGSFLAPDARRERLWRWLGPLLVTLLAAALRLWDLGHPRTLVFDETYYAKDAWTLLHLGYEARWPADSDAAFLAGETMSFTDDPSFVVHPPLGKWLIALGMAVLGADSPWGWRIAGALIGSAAVLVLTLVARRVTSSPAWGLLAGLFLAVDGLGISMSRLALLDGLLMFFVLLGFWFLVRDRETLVERLARSLARRRAEGGADTWGPVLWRRPWVVAAGAAFGAAAGVKWSAAWVLAAFGIALVVSDALARRRAGVVQWPAAAVLRQGPVTFLLFVPVAVLVYVASWTGWLAGSGGYDRGSDPNPLAALWRYHEAIYGFHVGLTSGHSYSSPAWQWPLLLRPTAMHFTRVEPGEAGCAVASGCAEHITSIPNPLLWYAGMAAVVVVTVRLLRRPADGAPRPWRHAIVLVGVGATYVPWLLYPERTIFQFYTVVMMPFVLLALVLALRALAGAPGADVGRRTSGQGVVAVFVLAVLLMSAFWYPSWTGMTVPYDFWRLHSPFPGWS